MSEVSQNSDASDTTAVLCLFLFPLFEYKFVPHIKKEEKLVKKNYKRDRHFSGITCEAHMLALLLARCVNFGSLTSKVGIREDPPHRWARTAPGTRSLARRVVIVTVLGKGLENLSRITYKMLFCSFCDPEINGRRCIYGIAFWLGFYFFSLLLL